ncbi:hypothetical protein AERO_00460 [Aeromicrobium fastidiosum]|uniref:hypothetical protein n=1 Tax=Aeromicrobium fastidiosum TaxID=52699 RepID=UPI0020235419|nr:hypothetical protein [Aeromicrobium fastidiosum]MCL8249840.1 hypothetical protein [Aeromicrobium fastidiosum]
MRSSLLSRSVIAVASLAIGSVALVAAPATAATPSGITRDAVLSLAAAARVDATAAATRTAARDILSRECALTTGESITTTENGLFVTSVAAVTPSATADGVSISGFVSLSGQPIRQCVVGVIAPTAPGFTLSGQATLSITTSSSPAQAQTTLSGDVSVSAINTIPNFTAVTGTTYSASGATSKTSTVRTSTKVKDKKTSKQKKAAKKKYDKKLKALKTSYKKALAKAGSSKAKKKAAQKSYSAKKKAAKATYRYAIAGYKIVRKVKTVTENRPFTAKAEQTILLP